jgi:hypothetical protein
LAGARLFNYGINGWLPVKGGQQRIVRGWKLNAAAERLAAIFIWPQIYAWFAPTLAPKETD